MYTFSMSKNGIITALVSLFIVVLLLFLVKVPAIGDLQDRHTGNAGEITGGALVGQTFKASQDNLRSIGVMMATYSGRDNTHPVVFALHESPDSAPLRSVSVHPRQFGDNQFYDFAFEPIADSADKSYFFSITSPKSVPKDAVTVNINTEDPYPSGVAHIRGSGRQQIDLAFRASYSVPLGTYAYRTAREAVATFIANWNDNRHIYKLWTGAFLPIGGFIVLAWYLFTTNRTIRTRYILITLALVAFCIRVLYARSLPFTVDEGNYLYDAWMLLHGTFAGGDGYVKAPLAIAWIALWEAILGHTAFEGRVASALAGSALVFPIFILVRTLWNERAALLSAGIWAVSGSAVVATIYTHTQPVALFFGVAGLALLAFALKEKQGAYSWLIPAGILIGFAVASRKSMLALGVAVVLLLMAYSPTLSRKWKNTLIFGCGFLAVLALFFTFAYSVYGTEGIIEAIGINSATDGISSIEESQVEQVRAYSLRGMTPFFRESLPLIFLSLLGLGFALQKRIFWLIPLSIFWWAWGFFAEYEGSAFMKYGIGVIWPLFGILLLAAAIFLPLKTKKGKNVAWLERFAPGLLGIAWVGGLAFFYMNWIKFHANYISEFIPPLAILAGVGIEHFVQRARAVRQIWVKRLAITAFLIVAAWSSVVSNFITYVFEHTGQFTQAAAKEAAQWAKDNIPHNEEIFTGAALIAYMSGHRVSLDIAHPRWYAYENIRTDTTRLETFLPPIPDMLEAYRNANWLLLESQTGFSFLMEYSEIEGGIEKDWEGVQGISNGSNTLTFYKRIHPDQ